MTAEDVIAMIDRLAEESERYRKLSEIGNTLARDLMVAGLLRAHSVCVSDALHQRLVNNLSERDGVPSYASEMRLCGVTVLGLPMMADGTAMLCDKDGNVLAIIEGIGAQETTIAEVRP